MTRKEFLTKVFLAAAAIGFPPALLSQQNQPPQTGITLDDLKAAAKVAGVEFTEAELQEILRQVQTASNQAKESRKNKLNNSVAPPTPFFPSSDRTSHKLTDIEYTTQITGVPKGEDLAFASVAEIAKLIRTKQISPVELTNFFLDRVKQYDERLLCLASLTEERALRMAKRAQDEIMSGNYRGPLHGIPCGIKDLFATKGYKTTWGADPYKDQILGYDAALVEKLDEAGAIIIAKLSLGALAMGDVWFKGRTMNPWNPEQGSSGSSAGSCAAVAAGLMPFAIGTETLGSIVSPSHQCRVTGLRPTFGRISRYGAMTLCWTMDKVGPICRTAQDCAIVLSQIIGADPRDESTIDKPFTYSSSESVRGKRMGVLLQPNDDPTGEAWERAKAQDFVKVLEELGVAIVPIQFEAPFPSAINILYVESGSAFDDFTLGEEIEELKNSTWPQSFRMARFISSVDYLRAMRMRREMMDRFAEKMKTIDFYVGPERALATLLTTNLTGHPQVLVPNGTAENGAQRSISFVGQLYGEAAICAAAWEYQRVVRHHEKRPDLSKV